MMLIMNKLQLTIALFLSIMKLPIPTLITREEDHELPGAYDADSDADAAVDGADSSSLVDHSNIIQDNAQLGND